MSIGNDLDWATTSSIDVKGHRINFVHQVGKFVKIVN